MENNNTLCIEDIMEDIRREIKEKNLTSDMLSFEDVPYRRAEDMGSEDGSSDAEAEISLRYINSHYAVEPYKQLSGNPIAVFVKKIIRKLTKFYIEPVVFEQNEFNGHAVKVINSMKKSEDGSDECSGKIDELLKRIELLELKQKSQSIQLEALKKENRRLRESAGRQERS
ncbi:MAG: hypothetical protein LIO40_01730 [Ruminococcus sp.]|nr:hypothetical protein [Ruminococcus sp.]